jgi:hypothetical protein
MAQSMARHIEDDGLYDLSGHLDQFLLNHLGGSYQRALQGDRLLACFILPVSQGGSEGPSGKPPLAISALFLLRKIETVVRSA